MNSKHTPGPWYFRNEDRPDPAGMAPIRYRVQNQPGQWVADAPNSDGTLGEWDCINIATYEAVALTFCGTAKHTAEANARLIAAAPDLLAACEVEDEWQRVQGNAVAVCDFMRKHGITAKRTVQDWLDENRRAAIAKAR